MEKSRNRRGLGLGSWGSNRAHAAGVSRQQRAHLAAVLIAFLALPAFAGDISFNPGITQQEFDQFSGVAGQAIFASPVEPAEGSSLIRFDAGVVLTTLDVDRSASYWVNSTQGDITSGGSLVVPRLVLMKGFGLFTLSGSYAEVPNSGLSIVGGAVDVNLFDGGLGWPKVAARGSWGDLRGSDNLDLTEWGAEAFVSKELGPVTPYVGAGMARTESTGRIDGVAVLSSRLDHRRITAGVRFSAGFWKIVVEAADGTDRTYAAKFSVGF